MKTQKNSTDVMESTKTKQNREILNLIRNPETQKSLSMASLLKSLKDNTELENLVTKDLRRQIYHNEVERVMTDGTGAFDKKKIFDGVSRSSRTRLSRGRENCERLSQE